MSLVESKVCNVMSSDVLNTLMLFKIHHEIHSTVNWYTKTLMFYKIHGPVNCCTNYIIHFTTKY